MENMGILIPFNLTKEFVDDVLCTAFEGGINHWCDRIDVRNDDFKGGKYASEVISRGGILDLVIDDGAFADFEEEKTQLTLEDFKKGYMRYVQWCKERDTEVLTDAGDIDAEIADIIVQYAVFDEIVFS